MNRGPLILVALALLAAPGCEQASPGAAVRVQAALIVVDVDDGVPRLVWGQASPPRAVGDPIDLIASESPRSLLDAWRGLPVLRDRTAPLRARFLPSAPSLALHPLARELALRGEVTTVLAEDCDLAWGEDAYLRVGLGSLQSAGLLGEAGDDSRGWVLYAVTREMAGPADRPDTWAELALRTLEGVAAVDSGSSVQADAAIEAAELLALLPAPGPDGLARLRAVQSALDGDPHLGWILVAARLRAGDPTALAEAEPEGLRVGRRSALGPLPISNGPRLGELLDLGRRGPESVFWTGLQRSSPDPALRAAVTPWATRPATPREDLSPSTVAGGALLLSLLGLALLRLAERTLNLDPAGAGRAWLLVGGLLCLCDLPLGGLDLAPDAAGVIALCCAARRLRRAEVAPGWALPLLALALPAGLAVELLAPPWPWDRLLGLPLLLGALGLLRALERLHARGERPVVAVWCRGALAVGALTGAVALWLPHPLVLPRPPADQPLLAQLARSAAVAEVALPLALPGLLLGLALLPTGSAPRPPRRRAPPTGPAEGSARLDSGPVTP